MRDHKGVLQRADLRRTKSHLRRAGFKRSCMESRSEGLSDPPTSSSMEKDFLLHQIAYGDSLAQQLACRESPSLSLQHVYRDFKASSSYQSPWPSSSSAEIPQRSLAFKFAYMDFMTAQLYRLLHLPACHIDSVVLQLVYADQLFYINSSTPNSISGLWFEYYQKTLIIGNKLQ